MHPPVTPPLISVVLATYNGERFLATQLDAIFAQTYSNIEVIASDDASTDGTWALLQQYAARHPNMQVTRNEQNLGYIQNFDQACRKASGYFIALCDQDDYWLPQKLEHLQAAIGNHALVHADSAICNAALESTGVRTSQRGHYQPLYSCLQQAVVCRIYGHATLFRSELLDKALPFPGMLPHDWWICFHATLHGGIAYLPEVLVHYRQHAHNAVGAVGENSRANRKRIAKAEQAAKARQRMAAFYQACPESLPFEKKVLGRLAASYQDFRFASNWKRMTLFSRYQGLLLAVKKRTRLRNWLFCLKMFGKVQ
ncbi:Glycosyltransferase involved in cell wall bisynthesis [Cnuella takakiae]|uniref:Glycosyltransferase involved in cell wall bisynthesis n=1 Tax=Cnuella takakiae TaxID=1302690 RepID=A0A1M5GTN4_9BACT|nr:glycosyltransferase family 2 protein [Cnuella takakiae]OLY90893.1 hypothetical protein BUE76_02525 [Cnuella takakiae]SHG07038.1 Glycosyltransferase involved in cell wall bisynthesis [Cnuella takakiae]